MLIHTTARWGGDFSRGGEVEGAEGQDEIRSLFKHSQLYVLPSLRGDNEPIKSCSPLSDNGNKNDRV